MTARRGRDWPRWALPAGVVALVVVVVGSVLLAVEPAAGAHAAIGS